MDVVKVLALESHWINPAHPNSTSGVDYARIINPMKHLAKVPGFEVEIRKDPFTKEDFNWQRICQRWDVIYTSYIDSDWGYVSMAVFAQRNNCKIVVDLDDNIWDIHPTSTVYKHYHDNGGENLFKATAILSDCKYLTTTNLKLKYKMIEKTGGSFDRIKVFPNYIDPDVYDHTKIIPQNHDTINIFWFGSGTHYMDLVHSPFTEGVDKLLKKYPNVKMWTVGAYLHQLKSKWQKNYSFLNGEPDFYRWAKDLWPKIMGMGDIFTAPILESSMTQCKSNIKWLETSMGKRPMVLQDIRQYRECVKDGVTGYLAKTGDEWFSKLEKLVLDSKLRKQMGEAAYDEVITNHNVRTRVEEYAEYFRKLARKD